MNRTFHWNKQTKAAVRVCGCVPTGAIIHFKLLLQGSASHAVILCPYSETIYMIAHRSFHCVSGICYTDIRLHIWPSDMTYSKTFDLWAWKDVCPPEEATHGDNVLFEALLDVCHQSSVVLLLFLSLRWFCWSSTSVRLNCCDQQKGIFGGCECKKFKCVAFFALLLTYLS